MTDELVSKFTWNQTQDTYGIGNTKLFNAFYNAARSCHLFAGPENKETFKMNMQDVLKSTKQRFRNKFKKGKKSNSTGTLQEKISEIESLLHDYQNDGDNGEESGVDEREVFDDEVGLDEDADDEGD
ncbi:uncharacterized protein LOC127291515 [Leptopilina boulardi]|uniref:uncharacterized protein LOC127280322 n=1 Tax=Leptopilina boulardi TaxID=63433 RepID=UPI0021F62337|nr:uncharacterized protein LOC127280322 [Leptopilina boulardi]XP_051176658.1 uncharacterized protein LOC127291515 [Leptopilina boulardi]